MFENNYKCANCKTGMDSLKLDPLSPVCPYIELVEDGLCAAYVSFEEDMNGSSQDNESDK